MDGMRRLAPSLCLALVSIAQARAERLTQAQLIEERQVVFATRTDPKVSCGLVVDARTDIVAFPAGRSDRIYSYGYGIGRAYVVRKGRAEMVWCGKALYTPEDTQRWGSKLPGNAARALAYPFGTKWGKWPVERGGMDVYSDFAGTLTTMRLNAAGEIVCTKTHDEDGNLRSAFQFDARDTCP